MDFFDFWINMTLFGLDWKRVNKQFWLDDTSLVPIVYFLKNECFQKVEILEKWIFQKSGFFWKNGYFETKCIYLKMDILKNGYFEVLGLIRYVLINSFDWTIILIVGTGRSSIMIRFNRFGIIGSDFDQPFQSISRSIIVFVHHYSWLFMIFGATLFLQKKNF